jgi:hypothetical protein
MGKKKSERKVYRDFTLDEFDEFTLGRMIEGAAEERGNIIAELRRHALELRTLSSYSKLPLPEDVFAHRAMGLEMAISIIQNLPDLEENVGCRECGAF